MPVPNMIPRVAEPFVAPKLLRNIKAVRPDRGSDISIISWHILSDRDGDMSPRRGAKVQQIACFRA